MGLRQLFHGLGNFVYCKLISTVIATAPPPPAPPLPPPPNSPNSPTPTTATTTTTTRLSAPTSSTSQQQASAYGIRTAGGRGGGRARGRGGGRGGGGGGGGEPSNYSNADRSCSDMSQPTVSFTKAEELGSKADPKTELWTIISVFLRMSSL